MPRDKKETNMEVILLVILALAILTAIVARIWGQEPAAGQNTLAGAVDAHALVQRAIAHRLEESKEHKPVRYVMVQKDAHGETTKHVIETRDGDVDRVIAVNGKPLDADAERTQLARLDEFAGHPEEQEKRHRSEQKVQAQMDHLASLVPDAFLYKAEDEETCAAGPCLRLSFTPNPSWQPPDRMSSLFRGVAGTVWIDKAQERLERLDAHFIANVDFGFGILGRVNKGGTVLVEQKDVGGSQWELTSLKVNVTGRMLLVKSFARQFDEEASKITLVPPMGYKDAIQQLKAEAGRAGANGSR